MVWERIPTEIWEQQDGHVKRYHMAGKLLKKGDTVIDAACGIGYGAKIMSEYADISYYGIDRIDGISPEFLPYGWFTAADLDTWKPKIEFDIAVCFETLEHLKNPKQLASVLCKAKRAAIVSVPTVPTKHINEFHLHDFTVDSLIDIFSLYKSVDVVEQPEELSHIFTFYFS